MKKKINELKNWDNKTWLSSSAYIDSFNTFLLKKKKLNKGSQILDIGCGRGKIFGALSRKLKLIKKPIGIDPVAHKDVDRGLDFRKENVFKFLKSNQIKFDLIMIKQTLHFFNRDKRTRLIKICKKNLKINGVLIIFSLVTENNEIPCFKLMKQKLKRSLERDSRMLTTINKLFSNYQIDIFKFKVSITKSKYIKMIQQRYISCLVNLNKDQISIGIKEIRKLFNKKINFIDKLIFIKYIKKT
tara:strand:- start:101 stop:829 length:729 start_codon:yes stop_codon:yes gene_type:complete